MRGLTVIRRFYCLSSSLVKHIGTLFTSRVTKEIYQRLGVITKIYVCSSLLRSILAFSSTSLLSGTIQIPSMPPHIIVPSGYNEIDFTLFVGRMLLLPTLARGTGYNDVFLCCLYQWVFSKIGVRMVNRRNPNDAGFKFPLGCRQSQPP